MENNLLDNGSQTPQKNVETTSIPSLKDLTMENHLPATDLQAPQNHVQITPIESTGADFQEFTMFPNLPAELREMIWKFALPGPRDVKVIRKAGALQEERSQVASVSSDFDIIYQLSDVFTMLEPEVIEDESPSAILHVCSESRYVGLKRYTFIPKGIFRHSVFFDFSRDTLCLPTTGMFLSNIVALPPTSSPQVIRKYHPGSAKELDTITIGENYIGESPAGTEPPSSSPNVLEQNLRHLSMRTIDCNPLVLRRFQSLTTLTMCIHEYKEDKLRVYNDLDGRTKETATEEVVSVLELPPEASLDMSPEYASKFLDHLLPKRPGIPNLAEIKMLSDSEWKDVYGGIANEKWL